MKIKTILFYTLFFSLIFGKITAQGNLYNLPLNDKMANSTDVLEGKVISKSCFWNENHSLIFTSNIIKVYKVFKGNDTASLVEIITEGGTIDYKMHIVEPSLNLDPGDIGIFTANVSKIYNPQSTINKSSVFQCYGSLQGFIKYDLTDRSATTPFKKYNDIKNEIYISIENIVGNTYREIIHFDVYSASSESTSGGNNNLRSSSSSNVLGGSISDFSPTTISAGTNSELTINGSGFGASQGSSVVQFKNADDGGNTYIQVPTAAQYISWSDTQIKVKVPYRAGTGTIQVVAATTMTSSTPLTISYAEMNVISSNVAYQTDQVNNNSAGGLTWQMYTGFNSNAPAKESFTRAMNTWRCNTHVNWILGSTTSVNTIGSDNTNVIRFDVGNELPAGVLGTCYIYWSGCGGTVWYVSELDMAIDDAANWQYGPAAPTGSQYDFESVMLHELGHGNQLGHVNNNADLMNYAISNAVSKRTLSSNNIAAVNDIMSRSTVANSCGPGPMTALTGQCAIGAPVANFSGTPVSGCATFSVTFSDLSTNSPTAWAWDINNDGTTDYTTSNPTGIFNTVGNYSVKLKVTNGFGQDSITKTNYITVNSPPATPTISASGATSFNSPDSVVLTSTVAPGYLWSNGATTRSIIVNKTGGYSVRINTSAVCSATSGATIVTVHYLASDTLATDINLDGVIDITDFLSVLGKYNQNCTCREDSDNNGVVNINDFLAVLGQYGQSI